MRFHNKDSDTSNDDLFGMQRVILRMEVVMKKDTRIIVGICMAFLLIAGFLFVKQQKDTSGVASEAFVSLEAESTKESTKEISKRSEKASDVPVECAVYISGAVKKPGLYRYHGTARVYDAIHAVGGFRKNAARDSVNLARMLSDGEQICVLTKKQSAKEKALGRKAASQKKETENTLVDINKASVEELLTLPGIGQAKAELIIAYRTKEGLFAKKEDLMKISGIKEGVYNKIKDLITIT